MVQAVGGPARARVIELFGAVLALNTADAATIGAIAPQLEHALHIGNTKIGLLSSVALLAGALFVIPVGVLVDRFRRIPMLSVSVLLWSLASLVSAFSINYEMLLLSRLALGAVTATAGPAVASLMGDYFPAGERGRVYGYILAGESAGAAVGFIISSGLAGATSWRVPFVLLALPGVFLARMLWRTVPEPLRGGKPCLETRAVGPSDADGSAADPDPVVEAPSSGGLAREIANRREVAADPERMGVIRALLYTLRIPSNRNLIVSSALGYFYFSGLETFAVLFVRGHYHANQGATQLVLAVMVVGAIVSTLISGKVTDGLLRRRVLEGRVLVPMFCYIAAPVALVPGILATSVRTGILFDVVGAALLTAANPGLDAARLDIVPARLWGRAESARTFLRSLAQAAAPLSFGAASQLIAGSAPAQPVGTQAPAVSPNVAKGLEDTFLFMLIAVLAAGLFLLRARKTYQHDVATAAAAQKVER